MEFDVQMIKGVSIKQQILKNKKIAIYGAGVIAYNVSKALYKLYGIETICYYVSNESEKVGFGGIKPQKICANLLQKQGNPLLLVATPEEYHKTIKENLNKLGIVKYALVDSDLEFEIMSRYFSKRKFEVLNNDRSTKNKEKEGNATLTNDSLYEGIFNVYMAKSVYDKKIKNATMLPNWINVVQAGKALSSQKIANLLDNTGYNISEKNRDYCELTVTYWVWKNIESRYKGICHYRRILDMDEQEIEIIMKNDVDVILPLPYLCNKNASEQYFRYISQEDFNVFCKVLKHIDENLAKSIIDTFNLNYIYNHNMLIAKNEVFDEYCKFVFTILAEVENYYFKMGKIRNDRYLGYLGELLTSAFFIINVDRLKIVHAKKKCFA